MGQDSRYWLDGRVLDGSTMAADDDTARWSAREMLMARGGGAEDVLMDGGGAPPSAPEAGCGYHR